MIQKLDSAIGKAKLPEDKTLYRGLNGFVWNQIQDLSPGDTWTHLPFASTSTDKTVAGGFRTPKGGVLQINAPAGTPGLYVAPLSKVPNEQETILPRGMTFRIKRVDPEERIIEVEPVLPAQNQGVGK
jgi:hypothetical protein